MHVPKSLHPIFCIALESAEKLEESKILIGADFFGGNWEKPIFRT